MNKTILQVPVSATIRRDAEKQALEQGFSSLQEAVRVFLKKLSQGTLGITFEEHNEVIIDIQVISLLSPKLNRTMPFKVDTGFNGDLQLTYQDVFTLGLVLKGIQPYRLADGSPITFFTCLGMAKFNKKTAACSIDVKPSGSHLVGIQLLKKLKCVMTIDFVNDKAKFVAGN